MKKTAVQYVCQNCGAQTTTWSGKCYTCGEWNTLQEELQVVADQVIKNGTRLKAATVSAVASKDASRRLQTGLSDVDTVLGGGLVAGSVNLIAGEPGIGKSTILLQIAHGLGNTEPVLYVSGEESAHQLGMRAERLGVSAQQLMVATSNSADDIAATIASGQYKLVIIDSIQTMSCAAISSAPGSVSQITNSTHLLTTAAKKN